VPTQVPTLNIEMETHYTDVEKKLWVYISNTELANRKRGWQETAESWQTIIAREIDPTNTRVDLQHFKRVTPPARERHLILDTPSAVARRALLDALKAARSKVRIHLHLSPQG
jgi:hypothetical protein